MPLAIAFSRAASHSAVTFFAIYSYTPATLHKSVTANPRRSSFALRSASDNPLSVSYVPSDATTARARFASANAYVRSVKPTSAASEGRERRGEV